MTINRAAAPPSEELEGGALSTADIVFFVLAGVAPMGAVVAILSLSIALGNGVGVPGTYLIAGVVLALFAAGYVQMSRRVTNTGGFYTYAREGLGKAAGGAAAFLAMITYNAGTIGIFGALAYFANLNFGPHGLNIVNLAWGWWALIFFVIVAALSYFEVTLSAKTLALALTCEVLVLLVFDIAVLARNGFHGFSLDVFKPKIVFGTGFGVSMMLAFGCFAGFEATALYGEEARDPKRSVPRATYIALATIAVFYLVTMWATISSFGVKQMTCTNLIAAGLAPKGTPAAMLQMPSVQCQADTDPNFMYTAMTHQVGHWATDVMQVLVVTSLFAAFLAFHCNTARYHFALARDGLLPRKLEHTHPKWGSPIIASAAQLTIVAVVTLVFGLAHKDPYLGMGIGLFGLGVLGIVTLQAIAAFSIVAFFLRKRQDENIIAALVAPVLGGLGLIGGLYYMVKNYSTLAAPPGTSSFHGMTDLPWALVAAVVTGAAVAIARSGSGRVFAATDSATAEVVR